MQYRDLAPAPVRDLRGMLVAIPALDPAVDREAYYHRGDPNRLWPDGKLHRSSTAAAVNIARIPALTMEPGPGHVPDPAIVRAAVAGMRNVLRWAEMRSSEREPITGIKVKSNPPNGVSQNKPNASRARPANSVESVC